MSEHNNTSITALILGAILAATCLFAGPKDACALEADKNAAVIFVYQRIGEDSVPESNISLEQFREHIRELKAGGYHVLPLQDIVAAMKPGAAPLPPRSVGITFEGAYLPTLNNALPILTEAEFPFTVFFSADQADANGPNHMTWDQLKTLKKNKLADFGILPAAYAHMTGNSDDANATLVNRAVSRYREMLKNTPEFFAWPYGEFSAALKKQIAPYHFKAAFGQQSGVVYEGADLLSLPRFTMTDDYGDLDRFRLTASALPLPVVDVVPDDMTVTQNPPGIGFTITPELKDLSRLSCFVSDIGKATLSHPAENRVEIRLQEPLQDRRTRVNCTMPAVAKAGEPQGWRWFGMLLVSPALAEADEGLDPAAPSGDAGAINIGGTSDTE